MARLFITPRELDFISHITSEVIKDVVGQKIYFFSVSLTKSRVHELYDEAPEKIFDSPIEINALVNWKETTPSAGVFGIETNREIEVFLSSRDIINKNIEMVEGDFISYGPQFFEINHITTMRSIYGQVEHSDGIKLVCKEAREGQFKAKILGPTGEEFNDAEAIQRTFVQQRGFDTNIEGPTGDVRELQQRGILEQPISGPRQIKPDSTDSSSFYDED